MPAFQQWSALDDCNVLGALGKIFHYFQANLRVRNLSAAKADGHFDLNAGSDKLDCILNLALNVDLLDGG